MTIENLKELIKSDLAQIKMKNMAAEAANLTPKNEAKEEI